MNSIEKDKIPTLMTGQNSPGRKMPDAGGEARQTPPEPKQQTVNDDSLTLSSAGQILNRPLSESASARTRPQSPEQAEALMVRIKQQFSSSGAQALSSHAIGDHSRLEGLLQSTPA